MVSKSDINAYQHGNIISFLNVLIDAESNIFRGIYKGLTLIEVNANSCHCHYTADFKTEKGEVLAKVRCSEFHVLQMIKNALEEAKADYKEVGRPLTLRIHDAKHDSLLSVAFSDDKEKKVSMDGILHCFLLLLMVTNVKNVLVSVKSNGFTLAKAIDQLIESKFYEDLSNYETISGLFILTIFTAVSFWIEIIASWRVHRYIICTLIILN